MNRMSDNLKALLIYVVIGAIGACITGYFLYQNKMGYWKRYACGSFQVALKQELEKRGVDKVYFAASGSFSLPADTGEYKVITLESKYGKREYVVPHFKFEHNIENNFQQRGLYSVILSKQPLDADALDAKWNRLLVDAGFGGKTGTRITVTDLLEQETCTYSDYRYEKTDSLLSYYIGCRCEVEVTGYIHCSLWDVFSWKDKMLLSAIVFACLLLFYLDKYIRRSGRHLLARRMSVKTVKDVDTRIYQLDDDLFFNPYTKELGNAETKTTLTAQMVILLQGFLDAKDYRLTIEEIMQLLWPEDTAVLASRVHSVIKRLREYIAKVSNDWIIENGNLGYQLKKKPHSIEKIRNK